MAGSTPSAGASPKAWRRSSKKAIRWFWSAMATSAGLVGMHCKLETGITPLISIDGIKLDEFDFVDIGAILEASGAVPVVIKSLVFPTQGLGKEALTTPETTAKSQDPIAPEPRFGRDVFSTTPSAPMPARRPLRPPP